jgi:hypothetical protein
VRLKNPNAKSLSALLAEDEQVMAHVHDLVSRLHRRKRHLAEHSMELDVDAVFAAGVVGALQIASLVVVAQLYTDTMTSPMSRIVIVAVWYDWFVSDGDGQRPPYSGRDALLYLERNVGFRFQRDVVVALRALCDHRAPARCSIAW